jgi:hypothetical protein
MKVSRLSAIFVGMIAFNNLCLQYVEVSFYTVARSLTIVFNVILSYWMLGERTSGATLVTLAAIILGFYVRANACAATLLADPVSAPPPPPCALPCALPRALSRAKPSAVAGQLLPALPCLSFPSGLCQPTLFPSHHGPVSRARACTCVLVRACFAAGHRRGSELFADRYHLWHPVLPVCVSKHHLHEGLPRRCGRCVDASRSRAGHSCLRVPSFAPCVLAIRVSRCAGACAPVAGGHRPSVCPPPTPRPCSALLPTPVFSLAFPHPSPALLPLRISTPHALSLRRPLRTIVNGVVMRAGAARSGFFVQYILL